MLRSLTPVTVAVSMLALSGVAWADDTCINAYGETQTSRRDGHLITAREHALECARSTCPKKLAKDCTGWIAELDEAIPSISLQARGSDGSDLVDVVVRMDGQPLVQKLDGKAIPVDPGSHRLLFTWSGAPSVEMEVVVHEGEKSRPISATFKIAAPPPPPPKPVPEPPPSRPIPLGALIAGAVTLVGIGFGTGFGVAGISQKGQLDGSGCKPRCNPSDVDSMMRSLSVADVSFAVAGVALLATVYLVITRPTVKASPTTTALLLGQF